MQATAIRRLPSLVLLASLAGASIAWSGEPKPQAEAATKPACEHAGAKPPAEPAPAAQAGMRAFIDPETGTLGVPAVLPPLDPQDAAALAAPEQPEEVILPDGSVMLDLKGACQEYLVLDLDANGGKSLRCVQDPKLATAKPATAPQPRDR